MKRLKNSKLSYRGFTMVELIFVIVIIGILSYMGSNFMPDNRLSNDTKFILMKIRQKQESAIGYSIAKFGEQPWKKNNPSVCIDIDKKSLNSIEKSSNEQKKHKIVSDISIEGNKTVCFDVYGRPYQDGKLMLKIKDINISKGDRKREVELFPVSGYVIIR